MFTKTNKSPPEPVPKKDDGENELNRKIAILEESKQEYAQELKEEEDRVKRDYEKLISLINKKKREFNAIIDNQKLKAIAKFKDVGVNKN